MTRQVPKKLVECTVKGCACQHHDTVPRLDTTLTDRDVLAVLTAFGMTPRGLGIE